MDIKEIKQLENISIKEIKERCYKVSANDGYTLKKGDFYTDALYIGASSDVFFEVVSLREKIVSENKAKYEGKTLEEAKEICIGEITAYDTSSKVNGFSLNGNVVWLDKATRVGLMNSTKIAKEAGQETTTLWLDNMMIEVDCDKAIQLLSALEMYALECFNVTAAHKQAVNKLTTVEEVEAFDITADYPQQLEMTV